MGTSSNTADSDPQRVPATSSPGADPLLPEIKASEQEVRAIVDAIPHTISVFSPDGSVLYVNRAFLEMTGFTLEEVMASDFRARLYHPDDLDRVREERAQALPRGLPFDTEQRARRKDGQFRWHLVRHYPLRDETGRVTRWYATGTDIDDRKRAEERMHGETLALREDLDRTSMFEEIVGSSAALHQVLAQVAKVAKTDSTVLILGETGTGKPPFPPHSLPPSCSDTKRGPSPALCNGGSGGSRQPMAARSFWTRSAISLRRHRSRCCACCRSGRSSAWAAVTRSRWTCACSRPPTAILRPT
jgi:PAS domain S-box-containing protein